jgi:hypothetical protein
LQLTLGAGFAAEALGGMAWEAVTKGRATATAAPAATRVVRRAGVTATDEDAAATGRAEATALSSGGGGDTLDADVAGSNEGNADDSFVTDALDALPL